MRFSFGILAALTTGLLACGAASDAPDDAAPVTSAAGGNPTTSTVDAASEGTIVVSLEPIDGIMVEGFEAGLRFETDDGEVIASTLWSDVVGPAPGSPDAYYTATHTQPVPAGMVVVHASMNVGIGPPPEVPDLEGDLRCALEVEVAPDERVEVELNFSGGDDCLRLL